MNSKHVVSLVLAAGLAAMSVGAAAQTFPSRPIRFLTSTAGSSSDLMARIVALGISPSLGQQVVVENRAFVNAADGTARAAPDGYTLLIAGQTLWVAPLFEKMPYDVQKDLAPITAVANTPNVLLLHPAVPARSVAQLIALAKESPGKLNYGTGPVGSDNHIAAELFKFMSKINAVRVPYKGSGAALLDTAAGNVQFVFPNMAGATELIKSGQVRAIAVTSVKRSSLMPDLPSIAETLPGYESIAPTGLLGPLKLPAPIIARMNQEVARYLRTPEARDRLLRLGSEIATGTPEEFGATIAGQVATMTKLIKDANIQPD